MTGPLCIYLCPASVRERESAREIKHAKKPKYSQNQFQNATNNEDSAKINDFLYSQVKNELVLTRK
jgi:hypothetical protein